MFNKSLIDRYQHRPREVQSMRLAEFAASYTVDYRGGDNDVNDCDALPGNNDSDLTVSSSKIVLTDGFGKMTKKDVLLLLGLDVIIKILTPIIGIELN